MAADWALISSEAQYFALQGVQGALEVIEQAKEYYNPDLECLGVVMNIADMRTVHSREAYAALREHFGDKVFDTVIRASIAYAESAETGRSILDHRPDLGRGLPRAGRRGARAHRARRAGGASSTPLLAAPPEARIAIAPRVRRRPRWPLPAARRRPRGAGERRAEPRRPPAPASRPAAGRDAELRRSGAAAAPRRRAGAGRPRGVRRATRCAPRPAGARVGADRAARPSSAARACSPCSRRRGGWLRVHRARAPQRPPGLDPRPRARASARTDLSLHVDRSARAPAVRDGDRAVLRRLPVAVGTPGHATPLGRFAVTDKLAMAGPAPRTAAARSRSPATRPTCPRAGPAATASPSTARSAPETIGQAASPRLPARDRARHALAAAPRPARRAGLHPRLERLIARTRRRRARRRPAGSRPRASRQPRAMARRARPAPDTSAPARSRGRAAARRRSPRGVAAGSSRRVALR